LFPSFALGLSAIAPYLEDLQKDSTVRQMVINSHLFSRVFDKAALALSVLSRYPIQLLTEADLQSHLFMALHEELKDELDSGQIGLHCQPRFFPSSGEQSGKRYPDLCILDRRYYFLASRNVSSKGFQIHGPSIQIEIKLRRLNYRGEQLAHWTKDLEKLTRWRDSWYGQNPPEASSADQFFPLFIVFSHLPIDQTSEWDALRQSARILKTSVIARDIDRTWKYRWDLEN
jgi:hypothetical protein